MKKDNYSYFCRDLGSCQSKENTNVEYQYPPAMTNLPLVYSPNLSISGLGLNDFLSGELSVIKVKLVSGVERFVCMDNDTKVYLSEEFTLDALFYNK